MKEGLATRTKRLSNPMPNSIKFITIQVHYQSSPTTLIQNVKIKLPKILPRLTLAAQTPKIVPLPFLGNQLVIKATHKGHPTLWNIPEKKKIKMKNHNPLIPLSDPNPSKMCKALTIMKPIPKSNLMLYLSPICPDIKRKNP